MTAKELKLEEFPIELSKEKSVGGEVVNSGIQALSALERAGCSHYSHNRTEKNCRPLASSLILNTKVKL
ncbi:hypothetical protein C4J81_00915 [Deltaproteobacteria bacterium Smac51]|nr:hypothetical protein C4J81_00915 [Deltaproteobacteria bacterium Smac51]